MKCPYCCDDEAKCVRDNCARCCNCGRDIEPKRPAIYGRIDLLKELIVEFGESATLAEVLFALQRQANGRPTTQIPIPGIGTDHDKNESRD